MLQEKLFCDERPEEERAQKATEWLVLEMCLLSLFSHYFTIEDPFFSRNISVLKYLSVSKDNRKIIRVLKAHISVFIASSPSLGSNPFPVNYSLQ